MALRRTYETRWSDVDANGHVRHTVYPELCAEARVGWLRDAGYGWDRFEREGLGPVLLREEIDYRRELRLGERVEVDLAAAGLSPDGGRWRLRHTLRREDGELVAEVLVLGGWLSLAARRLIPAPAALREVMFAVPRTSDYADLPPLRERRP
jgi:acyl-CoA thioester hydrolase